MKETTSEATTEKLVNWTVLIMALENGEDL